MFYCDPPYVGSEGYSLVNTIDHEALVDGLAGLEGDWICSYEDLPEVRSGVRARSRQEAVHQQREARVVEERERAVGDELRAGGGVVRDSRGTSGRYITY